MCVVEKKTYIHPDGRREIVESCHRCNRAVGNRPCSQVEHRSVGAARIVEVRPTSTRTPTSDDRMVTQGSTGQKVYRVVNRKNKSRPSSNRDSSTSNPSSSVNTPSSSTSPWNPIYVERRPSTATTPASSSSVSSRPPSVTWASRPPEIKRTIRSDNTASYDFPPSIGMPRVPVNERPSSSRPSSGTTSLAADVDINADADETIMPTYRTYRPNRADIVSGTSSPSNMSSSPPTSLPGLGNLPRVDRFRSDSVNDLSSSTSESSRSKGKQPMRADDTSDSDAAESRRQRRAREEARQASLENERLAATSHRQQAREREEARARLDRQRLADTELAAAEARERAEQNRRAAAAALEGDTAAQRTAEAAAQRAADKERERERKARQKRRVDAELQQMARERAETERRRESLESTYSRPQITDGSYPYTDARASPLSPRRGSGLPPPTWTAPASPSSSQYSARAVTRTPANVVVHNTLPGTTRPPPDSSIRARGEQVIARAQMRDAVGAMAAEEANELAFEDELDADLDAGRRPSRSQRDRNRERNERRRQEEGYF